MATEQRRALSVNQVNALAVFAMEYADAFAEFKVQLAIRGDTPTARKLGNDAARAWQGLLDAMEGMQPVTVIHS